MHLLALATDWWMLLAMAATSLAWPPVGSGAFWTIAGFYGVVSVLFDDETPRGVPGIEFIEARLHRGERRRA